MEKAILNQHTPGDWQYDDVWSLIMGPNGEEIAAIHAARGPQSASKSTAKANARLIASAPSLLSALLLCEDVIGQARLEGKLDNGGLSPVNRALVAARNAIDKLR